PKPKTKAHDPAPDDEATASESGDDAGGPAAGRDAPKPSPPKSPRPLPAREQAHSPPGSATASEDEAVPARPLPAKRGRGGIGKIGGAVRTRDEAAESVEGSEGGGGGVMKEEAKEEAKPERKVIPRPVK